jgi:trehalose/maltose hydrolase-like predicted phosphorylase
MFPILDVFNEQLGESLLRYRLERLPAAMSRAKQYGADGAYFPWTSTQTGFGTTQEQMNSTCYGRYDPEREGGCTGLGWQEQHINGDIAMAFRLHWHASQNVTFLRESFELINATAAFWASRFERHKESGNWTVHGVVGPDEPSGVQDSEVYTNAIGAQTILFARDAAAALKLPPPPEEWLAKAAAPFLPLTTELPDSHGMAIHPEFEGYAGGPSDCCNGGRPGGGCCIEQSAAALLQYPLGLALPEAVKRNDLAYYEPRTQANGFFTGDSIYSIAWLALGNTTAALTQWEAAFSHMSCDYFCLFRERLTGGHSNFVTGAGGFLQNIVQGWAGVRVSSGTLTLTGPTLPPTVTSVTLRSLQFRGTSFTVRFDAVSISFVLVGGHRASTQLTVSDGAGVVHKLSAVPVAMPLQPYTSFAIAPV